MEVWGAFQSSNKKIKVSSVENGISCASASRFSRLNKKSLEAPPTPAGFTSRGFKIDQVTPESQLQDARAAIEEFQHCKRSSANVCSKEALEPLKSQKSKLPLRMVVSNAAKRKLQYPAGPSQEEENPLTKIFSQPARRFSQAINDVTASSGHSQVHLGPFHSSFGELKKSFYSDGRSYLSQSTQKENTFSQLKQFTHQPSSYENDDLTYINSSSSLAETTNKKREPCGHEDWDTEDILNIEITEERMKFYLEDDFDSDLDGTSSSSNLLDLSPTLVSYNETEISSFEMSAIRNRVYSKPLEMIANNTPLLESPTHSSDRILAFKQQLNSMSIEEIFDVIEQLRQ